MKVSILLIHSQVQCTELCSNVLGHNIGVRFTPSVYKYILSIKCDLEDMRVEDAAVHRYKYYLLL